MMGPMLRIFLTQQTLRNTDWEYDVLGNTTVITLGFIEGNFMKYERTFTFPKPLGEYTRMKTISESSQAANYDLIGSLIGENSTSTVVN
jgi:hypothetical protein